MKNSSLFIIAVLLSQGSVTEAQSPWVLWGNDEGTVTYTSGRKKETNSWWIVDAYENFTQCKTAAVDHAAKGAQMWARKDRQVALIRDNAGARYSFLYEPTKEEQEKSEKFTRELLADEDTRKSLKAQGFSESEIEAHIQGSKVRRNRGTVKYICLPPGTDPRPRVKE